VAADARRYVCRIALMLLHIAHIELTPLLHFFFFCTPQRGPKPTAEDLDKELDSYHAATAME
jgi:hypothetical protein